MNLLLSILLTLFLVACGQPSSQPEQRFADEQREQMRADEDDEFRPGFGMSYTGKLGLEIAPGIIMTPTGPSFGFGF